MRTKVGIPYTLYNIYTYVTENEQILWQRCMEMFHGNVSEQQFQTWFSPMRLKSYDAAKKELAVYIPSQFFFEYLEEHFRRLIHVTISRFRLLTTAASRASTSSRWAGRPGTPSR